MKTIHEKLIAAAACCVLAFVVLSLTGSVLADDEPTLAEPEKTAAKTKEQPAAAPKLLPKPDDEADAKPAAPKSTAEAVALITEAHQRTKRQGLTEEDYTQVIEMCRTGMAAGVNKQTAAYARQLMAWAHNRRGEERAKAGRDNDALVDFEAAVDLDNNLWRAVHNRGVSFATLGKYREAIADFDRTIALQANYPNVYFNRGELRYEQGDFVGAVQDYTQTLRISPRDSAAYNSRGHAYYRMNRFREALADYSEAVKLEPENAAAYTNRGDAHADLGSYADAARDYRTAIRINGKLGRAYQSAAWLMATCPDVEFRNEDLGVQAAQKAIELDGDKDYRYLETLAAAQASAGDFDAAVETQTNVVKLAPEKETSRLQQRLESFRQHRPHREPARLAQQPRPQQQGAPQQGVSQQGMSQQPGPQQPFPPAGPNGPQRPGRFGRPNLGAQSRGAQR